MCPDDGQKGARVDRVFTARNRNPSPINRRAKYEKRVAECCIPVAAYHGPNRRGSAEVP
jgi:hypothetical protein